MSLPICPKCNQTDQIQKVTSIYASNTKEWKETSTGIDSWGNTVTTEHLRTAHTSLGLKLKPPDKPSGPMHPGLWYGIGLLIVFVLCSILCPLAFVPFSFILPALSFIPALVPGDSAIPAGIITTLAIVIPALCFIGIGIGLIAWLGIKVKRRFDSDLGKYKQKKAGFERDELPRWERAQARWEQLHYCMRDEALFIPGEGKTIPVDDMQKHLYDPMYRS